MEDILHGDGDGEELRPDRLGDVRSWGGERIVGIRLAGWEGQGEEPVAVAGLHESQLRAVLIDGV